MSGKQIEALMKASQKKKREAFKKTENAINNLLKNKQKITIRSVAREAEVSISYIYKHPELSYKIQRLREQQKYSLVKSDRVAEKKDDRIKILEQEKAELIKEIKQLRGNINRVETGGESQKSLQAENIRLQSKNQQLKQELKYTEQKLQEARAFILSQGYDNQEQAGVNKEENIIQQIE